MYRLPLVCISFFVFATPALGQLPELRDLDLKDWDCLIKFEGAAKTQDGKERNWKKNRAAIDVPEKIFHPSTPPHSLPGSRITIDRSEKITGASLASLKKNR